jgi:hypothetical protein
METALPGGPGEMFCVSPRRFCFGPGLNAFIRLLCLRNLIPSNGAAGSVVAPTQSECDGAKSGNKKASHK